MKKASEVFNKIRFAKLDPTHDKGPKGSTDDEEHGAVSEVEWNQQLAHQKKRAMQEKVEKPTGELKDACWKGYTAVGMKMKNGKKVPNCVPTNEQHTDAGKFQPVKPKMIQNTPVVSPRPSNDSATVKLKEDRMKSIRMIKALYKKKGVNEEVMIEEEIAGWIAHYNGQKHEIKKHEAKDLYDAKQKAIAHFKAPKSKHGLIAVKPAYNESVEQLDELSPGTLKSYVNKAKPELKSAQTERQDARDQKDWKAATIAGKTVNKRKEGIKTAKAKLNAEEVELEEGMYIDPKSGERYTYDPKSPTRNGKPWSHEDAIKSQITDKKKKQVEEGAFKRMATDAEEDKRLGSWKKETPWMPSKGTVTDKSGAKHTPMSRARDLARAAAKKNVKESVSITESRLADIVREAAESAKKKKKVEKEETSDKFQKDPELSTQITKND